jgi:hypothetical protein
MSKRLTTTTAAAAAAAVLAIGAYLVGTTQSDSSSATTSNASAPAGQGALQQAPNGTQAQPGFGQRGGFGNDVTGATADKVGKAATAKYPGNVERVEKLSDGSYLAHVITNNGEIYVSVSKSFKVTGTQQGPGGGLPPSGSSQSSPSGADVTTS